MTEVGQHPFITLLAYSEVEEILGSIGNFKVRVRKKARYVDTSKCVGCGECSKNCPVKYIPQVKENGNGPEKD
jgi:heterodisulfide reductase subunit A